MKFHEAVNQCKVRGYIYRKVNPKQRYYKNNVIPLEDKVKITDLQYDDWATGDPESDDNPLIG